MSSTSRGGKRNESDFYETPHWCLKRLLERLELPGGRWLEFAAGEGSIIRAVNSVRKDVDWIACELREECKKKLWEAGAGGVLIRDFLTLNEPANLREFSVAISNPPFGIAQEMIEHSLKFASHVIHLLRLNYLGTEKRNDFFKSNMPDIFVIPDRVSFAVSVRCAAHKDDGATFLSSRSRKCDFAVILPIGVEIPRRCPKCGAATGVSSTDSIEYAFFVFGPERGRRSGKIEVLNHTPVEQRR